MREFSKDVFDEIISGTGNTWYTPGSFNDLLGSADFLGIYAATTNVSGTSPTLTIQTQHSADGQNWVNVSGTAEIPATAIASNTGYYGSDNGVSPVLASFVRLQITLGGTSPQCRLKLSVTGRTY